MQIMRDIQTIESEHTEPIIALCTPKGSGALSLIRLSGNGIFAIATKLAQLAHNKKIAKLPTHTIQYGKIVDHNGQIIDQVLFFVMHAPHTFTGQDTIEITCHNNPFIIETIIQAAIRAGARLAKEGEFSRRAVLEGKIDLIQAEAINEVIQAQNQYALKQSLAQLSGSLSAYIERIEKLLIQALAFCQASFEFVEEEGLTFEDDMRRIIVQIQALINHIKQTFDYQQHIRQGVRIALIGSVNAGKSSLFNALLKQNRSIVTDIAGTTRDTIEAGIYRNGTYVTLIDTAGLRHTNDIIEKMGIERSEQEAHAADIILLIQDSSCQLTDQELAVYKGLQERYSTKIINLCTKSDLISAIPHAIHDCIPVSSKTSTNLDTIETAIANKIGDIFKRLESPFLINQRQQILLIKLEQQLTLIYQLLNTSFLEYEIIAFHLTESIAQLSELTGKSISEEAMDTVFRTFCVGK